MSEPTVVITRNRDDTVYVGTTLTLIASITFSDLTGVDLPLSVDISWTRDSDVINNDTHTRVSNISGSGTSYTATLMYSPITTDDSGMITATVIVKPSVKSQYIQNVTVMAQHMIDVQGTAGCMLLYIVTTSIILTLS